MPSAKKARRLAIEFEKAYPETLSERLAWWCSMLGINRFPFLRLMGLSTEEANLHKNKSWESILSNKEWEENGWWLEGKLHDLLSLFDYDWTALMEQIHQTAPAKGQYLPNANGTEFLLQVAAGGLDSFVALLAYLSRSSHPRGRSA